MNSNQINKCLKGIKNFKGVYARDMLPKSFKKPAFFVVNTDSRKEKGEHWVVIYVSEARVEYFDSLGFPPFGQNLTLFIQLHTKTKFYYSCKALQNANSTYCGLYCIAFIKHRSSGKSYKSFIDKFSRNTNKNDNLIMNESN